jgi:hypothetical protein
MSKTKKFKLAAILNGFLNVLYVLAFVWMILVVLCYLTLLFNPSSHWGKYLIYSTCLELYPADSTQIFTISSSDPSSVVDLKLLGYVSMQSGNRLYNLLAMIGFLIWIGLYLVVINQLRKIFSSISERKPFVDKNARRFRILGLCLIGAELVRLLTEFLIVNYIKKIITIPNAAVSNLTFDFYLEWLNLEIIFAGFAFLILAEAFKIGIHIQQEQDLTI